jgi:hypothetical protein
MGLVLTLIKVLCTLGPLFAGEISIMWEWEKADEDVVAFRYQMDAQEADGWTVVDSSVTSYSVGPVDDTVSYSLYLQQSYDGITWSESGQLTYDPVEFGAVEAAVEPVPGTVAVAEEPVVPEVAEKPVESMETIAFESSIPTFEPETMVQEPAVEEPLVQPVPVLEVKEPGLRVEVLVGAGGKADNYLGGFDASGDFIALRTRVLPSITADLVYPNMRSIGTSIHMGLRAGIGYQGYQTGAGTAIAGFDIHGLALFEYPINPKFSVDASVGFSFMFTGSDIHTGGGSALGIFFGPLAQVNARYEINDTWSIGLQTEARILFGNTFEPYELTGMVRLGVGYSF